MSLTHSHDTEEASIPYLYPGICVVQWFCHLCWGLEGWARWALGSESPGQMQRVAGSIGASSHLRSRCILGWATLLDNPILNFTARKGLPRPILWGTFTVTCIFCSIIWRGKATLSPFFFHVLCNMRVSCNSCCSPPWQQYPSEMGTATIPV